MWTVVNHTSHHDVPNPNLPLKWNLSLAYLRPEFMLVTQAELIGPDSHLLLSLDNSPARRSEWVSDVLIISNHTIILKHVLQKKYKNLDRQIFSDFHVPQGFSFLFRIICAIHLPAGSATRCFMMEKNVQVQHERLHSLWHFPVLLSLLRTLLKGVPLSPGC